MQLDQLRAFVAVVDHGTFDAAAAALHITPSAVSQRIKALESDVGQVVVQRQTPCAPTDPGAVLLRMARGMAILEQDALAELGDAESSAPVPVAVNADSLETWFVPVLSAAAEWPDPLRLEVEDQDHSIRLLRRGDVVGAVTSQPGGLAGCTSELLGSMRYLPVAAPALRDRHRRSGRIDWAHMPMLRFNAKDDLQRRYLARRRCTETPPVVQVPSSWGFVAAARAGLAWGMIPQAQVETSLADGDLVRLGRDHIDQPLYWQVWRLASPRIQRLTDAIRAAARDQLRRPQAPGGQPRPS